MSQFVIDNTFPRTQDGPGQLYGYNLPVLSDQYTGYLFPPAFGGAAFQVQGPLSGPDDDVFIGNTSGGWADAFFGAIGDDTLSGLTGGDYLVGGSGDDSIQGQDDNDFLYGDYTDTHIVVNENGFSLWRVPSEADASVVGNDLLDGGNGADTLDGGPGNDQLTGGPRGQGNTDVLTGGDDADAFYLTYTQQSSGGGGTSFWAGFAEQYVPGIAGNAVTAGVNKLAPLIAQQFFTSVAGSVLLGGMSTALGDLVNEGISLLFGMNKSATPQPTGEDVMVITDFNPRQDVLFLPLNTSGGTSSDAQSLIASVVNFGASGNPSSASGQTGWGIEFTKGTTNTIFAEVFLDPDFLADFGVTSNSEPAKAFINDVFDLAVVIDENGIQQSTDVYPFPTDPSAYTDGVLPAVADTPVDFKAPSGTLTRVYGAFGPHVVVGPSVTNNNTYVAGTDMGDLIFITTNGFVPESWDNAAVVAQVANASVIFGYDGDDIINGSAGEDSIHGGDGDDFIYGWNAAFAPLRDQLYGDAGNDTLFAAKPSGSLNSRAAADFFGGDDIDTVSFAYSRESVTASLAAGIGVNGGDDSTAGAAYTFTNVENLTGTDQDDSLTGDGNDNVLQGNAGNDTLDGGDGSDTASYADNTGRVAVSLPEGSAQEFGANGGSDADTVVSTDTLTNIENATGSAFDDTFTGDGNDNILQGNAGSDTLDGGGGSDTASYADNTGKVRVSLADGSTHEFGVDGGSDADTVVSTDTVTSIENAAGSAYNDTLEGDGNGNVLEGNAGLDFLAGDAGADTLLGGDGDDTLNGGEGDDTLDGEDGFDAADYSANAGKVAVDLTAGTAQEYGANGSADSGTVVSTDTFRNIEGAIGSVFTDTLAGDANANRLFGSADSNASEDLADNLSGGGGDDSLYGQGGDDTLNGGEGNDSLSGGDGTDTADYSANTGRVTVNLATGTGQEFGADGTSSANTILYTDTLVSIEIVSGSNYNDVLTANASVSTTLIGASGFDMLNGSNDYDSPDWIDGGDNDDTIYGNEGDDTLIGGPGNDRIYGGNDSDLLMGNENSDQLDGQGGSDKVSYTQNTGRVVVNLQTQTASEYGAAGSSSANTVVSTDKLTSIENAFGSPYDDQLIALSAGSELLGEAGNDTLQGSDGPDTLEGGDGNDVMNGGDQPDSIIGGDGDDSMSGDVAEDTLNGGDGNDVMSGGDQADSIIGGDGDDTISGDESSDRLDGEGGFNTLSYANNTGKVRVALYEDTASGGGDNVQEYGADGSSDANTVVSQDRAIAFQAVLGSAYNDTITGNSSDNTLWGNAGDDSLTGGAGVDTFVLAKGDGSDTITDFEKGVDLIGLADGLTFDDLTFSGSSIHDGSATLATLTGVNATTLTQNDFVTLDPDVADDPISDGGGGTSGDDFIVGSDEADTLAGGSGNDTLTGNGGDDDLNGGSDNDVVRGGWGADSVRAGSGDDTASGGDGDDYVLGGSGDDILAGGDGDDTVLGNDDDDEISGGSGADSLLGGGGDDMLTGGPGDDTVEGGPGDDTFVLGKGDGTDAVTDFGVGSDLIGLSGSLKFDDLSFAGSEILVDGDTLAILNGVIATTLTEDDFILV